MQYKIVKEQSASILWLIVVVIIFFCFILPKIEKCYARENRELLEKFSTLGQCDKVDLDVCSPACCGSQWPTGIKLTDKTITELDIINKYVPSNYTCSGTGKGQGPGCVCIPKSQRKFLYNRGGNRQTFNLNNIDMLTGKSK
ncbi:hypothetical protein CPAV1605_595 [seawater metagenome]|uniref:Uncharacterized protein n=1 Tax=seawater metagenome TaxID=1561972 RepID=A0A5E8CM57_9ZZZZ